VDKQHKLACIWIPAILFPSFASRDVPSCLHSPRPRALRHTLAHLLLLLRKLLEGLALDALALVDQEDAGEEHQHPEHEQDVVFSLNVHGRPSARRIKTEG
jgi:hypothetical protein